MHFGVDPPDMEDHILNWLAGQIDLTLKSANTVMHHCSNPLALAPQHLLLLHHVQHLLLHVQQLLLHVHNLIMLVQRIPGSSFILPL